MCYSLIISKLGSHLRGSNLLVKSLFGSNSEKHIQLNSLVKWQKRIYSLLLWLLVSRVGWAQSEALVFYAKGSIYQTVTQFAGEIKTDSIYILPAATPADKLFTLYAKRMDGALSEFIVERFEPGNWRGEFVEVKRNANVLEAKYPNLTSGGYRLRSVIGSDTISKVVWCFIDDLTLDTILVDNKCEELVLTPRFSWDFDDIRYEKFVYYNHRAESGAMLSNDVLGKNYFKQVEWKAHGQGSAAIASALKGAGMIARLSSPTLLEEASFTVKVRNLFGREFERKTATIDPMAVKARMTIELNERAPLEDLQKEWRAKESPIAGQSPYEIRLKSESMNNDSVRVEIYNDIRAIRRGEERVIYSQTLTQTGAAEWLMPPVSLFSAGHYLAWMTVWNSYTGCIDTMTVQLQVDSSLISPRAIPNVFTPNQDGINDRFIFIQAEQNVRSIREFEVSIYSRQGQRVYYYQGNIHQWEGWDGTIGRSHRKAAPGVYYYIIRARGWDEREFTGNEYRGALHLF